MSKADNKELEEAIKSLKKVSNAKSGCSYEIALFDFGEHAETVLKELERLQNEETRKFLDIRNYYEYNNTVDTLNKFVKEIDTQMHPVTTKTYREEIKSAIKNIIENIRININIETLKEKQAEIERLQEENNKLERANKTYINSIQSITPVLLEDYIAKDKIREKMVIDNSKLNNCTNYILKNIYKARNDFGQELLEGK